MSLVCAMLKRSASLTVLVLSMQCAMGQQPVAKNNRTLSPRHSAADTMGRQPLLVVLKALNQSKGVFFLYAEENMSQRLVNTPGRLDGDLDQLLTDVLRNTGLKHKRISPNTVVILNNDEKGSREQVYYRADIAGDIDSNPGVTVSGKVSNTEGQALPGATIWIKGTTKGATANSRGEFSLSVLPGQILQISSVGYRNLELPVQRDKYITAVLQQTEAEMSEVVVTALGITKEQRSIGFSATRLTGDVFTQAREINLGNALAGLVAGVNSSAPLTGPGGSSRVTIRGNSSLSFDNQPLYVVNGIPINNDNLGSAGKYGGADFGDGIVSINADDIDEITVLKGGAAAALYGQRGRNGIILISTKKGKPSRELGVEWNSNFVTDHINDFTRWQQQYGQGFQGNKPVDRTSALMSGLYAWGARLDGTPVPVFDGSLHPYSPVSRGNMHSFYRTGMTATNTIGLSGGSESARFRVSLGDLRSQSVYPKAGFNRQNIQADLQYRFSDQWSGLTNISYIREVGKNRSNLSDAPGNGNFAILFLPPNVKAGYLAPGYDASGHETQFNDNAFNTNPYFASSRFSNDTYRDRVMGVTSLRYQPVSWFYVQGRLAHDFFAFNASSLTPAGTAYKPTGTVNLERSYTYNETNADLLMGVKRQLSKKIQVSMVAGANLLRMRARVLDVSADGLAFPFIYNPGSANTPSPNLVTPRKEVHSVYGAVELSYRDRLFLSLTDRNDWSSTLPQGKNSYNYPSASLSWQFDGWRKEDPAAKKWFSSGRLRAAYSMVGGDAPIFSTRQYYSIMGEINGAPIGNIGNEIPNQALEPLKVTETELGAELNFFDNRLRFDIAWYNKHTLNDIVAATVSGTSGYSSALLNVGRIRNRGIELLLAGTPVQQASFGWKTSFNFAHNQNRIIRLAQKQTSMQVMNGESRTERGYIQHIVGLPFSQIMVYTIKRNANGQPVLGANGLQPSDALVPMGTGVHPITGGWSNDLRWGKFQFSFLIDYKFGASLYSGTNATAVQRGLHPLTLDGRETGVLVKGVDALEHDVEKTIPAQQYYEALYRISALQVYDAGFVKFRSASIGWRHPLKLSKKKEATLQVSLVGRNLFYIYKATPHIDPESNYSNGNAQGLEYAAMPSVRSFGINLQLRF